MALLLAGPAHRLGDAGIGLVGLAGVAGALMASVAGRMADRGQAQVATALSVGLLLLGWVALWLGASSLAWFVVGMLVADLALQGVHISNQNVIYRLDPTARARLNAVYMTATLWVPPRDRPWGRWPGCGAAGAPPVRWGWVLPY